jgi:D-alanine-D-alanine ligase
MKVLLLFDVPEAFASGHDYKAEFADRENYATEGDVHRALLEDGHEVRLLGLYDDVQPLLDEVKRHRPDVIFNLVELFHDTTHWDKNIVALIEMLGVPHTGASSAALFLCNDKAMCKKILRFHRVRTPRFHTLYRGGLVWLPATVKFPCIAKPLTEEASRASPRRSLGCDEALPRSPSS